MTYLLATNVCIRFLNGTTGRPIGPNDLLIAAIACANTLTLVTHNTREFSRVPALQLDDWEYNALFMAVEGYPANPITPPCEASP
jgi:predicted nucleic acid-binding protein